MTKPAAKTRSYIGRLDSTGYAPLLGGVKATESSRFATYEDAALWLAVAKDTNEKAGRHCIGSIFPSTRRPEIAAQDGAL